MPGFRKKGCTFMANHFWIMDLGWGGCVGIGEKGVNGGGGEDKGEERDGEKGGGMGEGIGRNATNCSFYLSLTANIIYFPLQMILTLYK